MCNTDKILKDTSSIDARHFEVIQQLNCFFSVRIILITFPYLSKIQIFQIKDKNYRSTWHNRLYIATSSWWVLGNDNGNIIIVLYNKIPAPSQSKNHKTAVPVTDIHSSTHTIQKSTIYVFISEWQVYTLWRNMWLEFQDVLCWAMTFHTILHYKITSHCVRYISLWEHIGLQAYTSFRAIIYPVTASTSDFSPPGYNYSDVGTQWKFVKSVSYSVKILQYL